MIAFIDPFSRGLSHVPVNVGLLEAALLASPEKSATVAAENEHLAAMLDLLDDGLRSRVRQAIEIVPPAPDTAFTGRLRADLVSFRTLLAQCDRTTTLVVGALEPATLYALRVALMGRRRTIDRIAAILHGNAAQIAGWRARNPFVRLTQLRAALGWAPPDTRFVVLESSIRRALLEAAPELSGRLHVVPHPLPLAEARSSSDAAQPREPAGTGGLKIAFLGGAYPNKGFAAFLTLARALKGRRGDAFEFQAIGWLPPQSAGLDMSSLSLRPAPHKIDRAQFVTALSGVDYVCMPYDPGAYRFSASGTLLDAIAHAKPVLAIRTPMLDDLRRDFGDIGEFGDSIEDLCNCIESLPTAGTAERYKLQVANLSRIAASRSPVFVAAALDALWAGP
jgi:hypothetical protein